MAFKELTQKLSLDDFFKKAFEAFYRFRLDHHSPGHLEKADVIVALSFGMRENGPGESNRHVARIVEDLHNRYKLPVIAQWEIGDDVLIDNDYLPHIVREPRPRTLGRFDNLLGKVFGTSKKDGSKAYLDTYEVLAQAANVAHPRGWRKAIIVAHGDHGWRVAKTAERFGFEVLVPYAQTHAYDRESIQSYTRSRLRFLPREIATRFYYILKGWL